MAQKAILSDDEYGRHWMVFEGDVGWPHCQTLSKLGVTAVVMPRSYLMKGELTPAPSTEAYTPELIQASPELRILVKRLIRLRDCLMYLERHD